MRKTSPMFCTFCHTFLPSWHNLTILTMSASLKHGFTFVILAVQYVMPLVVLPIVHANILLFLR